MNPAAGPSISRIILYVKEVAKVAEFYERFFGMLRMPGETAGWVQLSSAAGGCTIAIHKAAVSQKSGAAMKLVFGVRDVRAFKETSEAGGLKFGPIHSPEGFEFCNAKDPAGNSISISSRGMI